MTAGLPGTGIGGFFYLLSALLMPVNECIYTVLGRSRPARWRKVSRQTLCSLGILAGIWCTAWILAHILHCAHQLSSSAPSEVPQLLRIAALTFGLATLLAVILVTEIFGIIAALRKR
ncbi:MAG TPA: hypothetical protein VMD52_08155 [Patescibacteria group bacterium]|nr:hypothetical protein [Patescibacteria group bacterium]